MVIRLVNRETGTGFPSLERVTNMEYQDANAEPTCQQCCREGVEAEEYPLNLNQAGKELEIHLCNECIMEILRLDAVSLRG